MSAARPLRLRHAALALTAGLLCALPFLGGAADPERPAEERLAELQLRAIGLEGKLKESALARKTAEQGRMESERRLAEGIQENERLRAELQRLSAARAELENRLAERDTERSQLAAGLLAMTNARDTLDSRLRSLQSRVPITEGGTLSVDEARTAAAEALTTLRGLAARPGGIRGGGGREAAAAIAALRHRQLMVACATEAQSLYRVRPNDSLALISQRFHGTSGQWRAIYEANRHLLTDPDQLIPGMTLVIP